MSIIEQTGIVETVIATATIDGHDIKYYAREALSGAALAATKDRAEEYRDFRAKRALTRLVEDIYDDHKGDIS